MEDYTNNAADSLEVNLESPVFSSQGSFIYPGRKYESSFFSLDTARTIVLGRTGDGKPNFIEFKTGNGAIFINSTPLAFSNYFILHKNNIKYFESALSVIPPKVERIDWNEFYLSKPSASGEKDPSWFRVLFRYPAFKWGMLTALLFMLLYLILGMRRQQRMVPLRLRPANDSLDFVKTMGRLYYDRHDHLNLAKKMSAYFLEHIRSNYKIQTTTLDESFMQKLQSKSNYEYSEINQIVSYINYLDGMPNVTDQQLGAFHRKLELFYQNT